MTRRKPQKGRFGFWLREVADTGEGTIDGILTTMLQYGTPDPDRLCLALKVADGTRWQGQNDAKTPINSLDDVLAVQQQCWARNVEFLPVVVPRGRNPEQEGAMHGAVAAAIGALMVDAEPYDGFFDTNQDQIPAYCTALRNAAGDAYLMLQPDPRTYGLQGIGWPGIATSFDALCGQHYVGWAGVNWMDVAAEVTRFRTLGAAGLEMYATIYGADGTFPARQQAPVSFWNAIAAEAQGVNIFAFGPMNLAQLQAMQGLALPGVDADPIHSKPEPPPVPVDDTQRLQLIQLFSEPIADLADATTAYSDAAAYALQCAQAVVAMLQGASNAQG